MEILGVKPELCTGCHICEEVCSKTYFKEVDISKSAIWIGPKPSADEPHRIVVCDQRGVCVDVCPTMALRRTKKGFVRLDKKLCVGCLACVGFCPIHAMRTHPDHTEPFKCVACGKCADECPTGALFMMDVPDPALTETEKWG